MKQFFLTLLACFLPFLLHSSLNMDQLCEKTAGVVVEVIGTDKPGWFISTQTSWWIHGFFLNQDGYVLTCKTFLEGKENFQIRWIDIQGYSHTKPAMIISKHPTEDVAILKIDSPPENIPHCSLLFEPVTVNSCVFLSFSNIEGEEKFPVMGKVLYIFRKRGIYEAMIAIPNFIGGRGAPIFDTHGSIIGIQTGAYIKNNFICCHPLFHLEDWIDRTLE